MSFNGIASSQWSTTFTNGGCHIIHCEVLQWQQIFVNAIIDTELIWWWQIKNQTPFPGWLFGITPKGLNCKPGMLSFSKCPMSQWPFPLHPPPLSRSQLWKHVPSPILCCFLLACRNSVGSHNQCGNLQIYPWEETQQIIYQGGYSMLAPMLPGRGE